jgi:hypothetical protein
MENIHDDKPALSAGTGSIFVDLVFWKPRDRHSAPLLTFLEETHLGERSQTVEWLTKFTVRLSMWHGQFWPDLPSDQWAAAQKDLQEFISKTMNHYHIPKTEYDTRAFNVGLAKKVPRRRVRLSELNLQKPGRDNPAWWMIVP